MNVITANTLLTQQQKKSFSLKPVKKDGLILQIHHTVPNSLYNKRIRFIHSTFDHSGLVLACADINGNIFITDFSCNKYWAITKLKISTTLAFSVLNNDELIVACKDGNLCIVNIHLGTVLGILEGHLNSVNNISFAQEQCLTVSATQAIIFNLNSFERLHELSINTDSKIKQMFFMPVTHHILACFMDDYIHVWKNGSFESFKKLLPSEWNRFCIKTIAITRNGTTMVLGGVSSKLIVFSLDSWVLTKILNLSDEINVKSIEFVSQPHDGGANKFIIILTKNGIVNILDMEQSVVIAKIRQPSEIISFACSSNGTHLSCILRSGEVNIHKMSLVIEPSTSMPDKLTHEQPELVNTSSKLKLFMPSIKPREELNLSRLQNILKEYGEYPENYRTLIWTKILLLPCNINCYGAISAKGLNPFYANIEKKYPLENKLVLKNFKRLLSNLANWDSALCTMDFLPLFVFPFVKIFENDPVLCFEAVITITMNWCQHWFEYAPVAPVNILAMVENVFSDHDPELLAILTENKITSHLYAWSLLEVGFSEVLSIKEWCILWDHILSNEPTFFIVAPVAYNIMNRSILATIDSYEKFETFYHNQNAISFKRFIAKIYFLLRYTRPAIHPRQYLKDFIPLPKNCYPFFGDGPKATIVTTSDAESKSSFTNRTKLSTATGILKKNSTHCLRVDNAHSRLRGGSQKVRRNATCANDSGNSIDDFEEENSTCIHENNIDAIELEISKVQSKIKKLKSDKAKQKNMIALKCQEAERIKKLENILQEKLHQEKLVAEKRKLELSRLKTELFDMQAESIEKTHRKLEKMSLEDRKHELDTIIHQIDCLQKQDELEIQRTDEELSRHYFELLKQKTALENILLQSVDDDDLLAANYAIIDEQRKTINDELQKMRQNIIVARINCKLNMSSRMTIENDKLTKIDVALAKEMAHKQRQLSSCNSNIQLFKMEQDTKSLENEVEQLLEQFSLSNTEKIQYKMNQIKESLSGRRNLINKELELMDLRKLIKESNDDDNECFCDSEKCRSSTN